MTITRLKTVYIVANRVAECAEFYESVLALPVKFRDGDQWVQFDGNGAGFAVASKEEAATGATGAVIVFDATEEADHDTVLDAGAVLIETRDMGDHGRTHTYRDPAGNLFQLFWRATV